MYPSYCRDKSVRFWLCPTPLSRPTVVVSPSLDNEYHLNRRQTNPCVTYNFTDVLYKSCILVQLSGNCVSVLDTYNKRQKDKMIFNKTRVVTSMTRGTPMCHIHCTSKHDSLFMVYSTYQRQATAPHRSAKLNVFKWSQLIQLGHSHKDWYKINVRIILSTWQMIVNKYMISNSVNSKDIERRVISVMSERQRTSAWYETMQHCHQL